MGVLKTHERDHQMAAPTVSVLDELRKLGIEFDPGFLRQAVALMMRVPWTPRCRRSSALSVTSALTSVPPSATAIVNATGKLVSAMSRSRSRNATAHTFPRFSSASPRAERALLAVIQHAYVEGVSTRKVDDLVQALGLSGIDKSTVSRICQELDSAVSAFRNRHSTPSFRMSGFDALYLKVRQNHRIVSMAVVIAIGVKESGERCILDLDIRRARVGV